MNVQMPEMDGLEANRQIRELDTGHWTLNPGNSKLKWLNPQYPISTVQHPFPSVQCRIYIIAVTANAMHGDREQCLAAGMDDYISKPFEVQELVEALKKAEPQRHRDTEIHEEQKAVNGKRKAAVRRGSLEGEKNGILIIPSTQHPVQSSIPRQSNDWKQRSVNKQQQCCRS